MPPQVTVRTGHDIALWVIVKPNTRMIRNIQDCTSQAVKVNIARRLQGDEVEKWNISLSVMEVE